ncbi:class I SAM-dependent methyltransferase [Cyanobium sp. Aljojuca 7D2]|uniref:class I SAM-dependent methyltransferase n=1 Tax=Cyanobium sp. Aljojuca 7D2 TaxID=2823698 RepID=UPI0020CFB493|nr:class I SAM-dependent methyltransferase [Cyanobium sp. Aljojuca 7D2]MCP9890255.1 class I SAM-dependent methyltransferase [Cyanobium sp. Aljojuca 7D2]
MDTIEANQIIHGQLARMGEYDKSPHFYPENIEFVKSLFTNFFDKLLLGPQSVLSDCLDLGCGTGFMYHILQCHDLDNYVGIDITEDMLSVCRQKYPKISLEIANAEDLPFSEHSFSIVTSYSFLDHLDSPVKVIEEAYRVLKEGGVFYSGLIPNAEFSFNLLSASNSSGQYLWNSYEHQLTREIKAMYNNGAVYAEMYGFDANILQQAEPQKTQHHGLMIDDTINQLKEVGFKRVLICPNWFFGQGLLKTNLEQMKVVDNFLKSLGPVSRALFKYYDFFAVK